VDSGLTTNLFGYNMRSELADAIMGTNVYAYLYDPIGNRQLASANENTNLYQANELNQYTNINAGAVEPVYDPDGNMTSYGSWQFTWDAENRLVKVAPHYLITGSRIYEYGYDYMSRRVKKTAKRYTMPMSTWTMRTFDYDGWNLVRERVEFDGAVSTNQYVWGLDLSGTLQGAGGVGGLLCWIEGRDGSPSRPFFPSYDANGNITDLVDTNGTAVAHYEYDPYGNTIAQSGTQAEANPFRFSTKYWDGETGFYYYGYRFYSPVLGRWLNRDPIGERGGRNLYNFVFNSGINIIDKLGLCCKQEDVDKAAKEAVKLGLARTDSSEYEYCGILCCDPKSGEVDIIGPHRGFIDVQTFANGVKSCRPVCNPKRAFQRSLNNLEGSILVECPKGMKEVGDFHTHPAGGSQPSPGDYPWAAGRPYDKKCGCGSYVGGVGDDEICRIGPDPYGEDDIYMPLSPGTN
jgi:RHS repeat-associated protein